MPTKDSFLQIVLYTRQNWIDFLTDGGIEDAASDPRLDTPVARNRHYADLYTTINWLPPEELPALRPYMRAKYRELPETAVAEVERYIADLAKKHGSGPADREDEQ